MKRHFEPAGSRFEAPSLVGPAVAEPFSFDLHRAYRSIFPAKTIMSGVSAVSTDHEILAERPMPPGLPLGVSGPCFQARAVSHAVASHCNILTT
jgi:hypothetical protein